MQSTAVSPMSAELTGLFVTESERLARPYVKSHSHMLYCIILQTVRQMILYEVVGMTDYTYNAYRKFPVICCCCCSCCWDKKTPFLKSQLFGRGANSTNVWAKIVGLVRSLMWGRVPWDHHYTVHGTRMTGAPHWCSCGEVHPGRGSKLLHGMI